MVKFPCLLGTSESLRLPTALFLRFLFPLRYRPALASLLPCRSERHPTWAWGLSPVSPPGLLDGNGRISQVPEGPLCLHALLSDPGRISVLCRLAPRYCLPPLPQRRLLHCALSGLNRTACRLPVYASQDGLPHLHATLGSGCWHACRAGLITRRVPTKSFQNSRSFPLSQASPGAR